MDAGLVVVRGVDLVIMGEDMDAALVEMGEEDMEEEEGGTEEGAKGGEEDDSEEEEGKTEEGAKGGEDEGVEREMNEDVELREVGMTWTVMYRRTRLTGIRSETQWRERAGSFPT